MARQALPRLTSLRWYAAVVVFLAHVDLFTNWRPLHVFSFGGTAVTFFFVLSGFVLAWSSPPGQPARRFYRRRFARIYPSYLVMILVGGAIIRFWPAVEIQRSSVAAVAVLVAVQSWIPIRSAGVALAFDPPAWSLSAEAFFYASFPFVAQGLHRLKIRHRDYLAAGLLAGAAIATEVLSLSGWAEFAYVDPLVRSAEFVFGMVLAMRMQAGWRPRLTFRTALALLGIGSLVAWLLGSVPAWEHVGAPLEDYAVVLPGGLLLVSAAAADLDGNPSLLTRRVSIYFGELSFAFYLVHYLVVLGFVQGLGWGRSWTGFEGVGPTTVIFAAALAAAMLLHHVVELPFQRRLQGKGRPPVATANPIALAQA